jgi:hypothetical protein
MSKKMSWYLNKNKSCLTVIAMRVSGKMEKGMEKES